MIYILKGCSGEYEDYTEKILCSFDDKDEANKIKEILENLIDYINNPKKFKNVNEDRLLNLQDAVESILDYDDE